MQCRAGQGRGGGRAGSEAEAGQGQRQGRAGVESFLHTAIFFSTTQLRRHLQRQQPSSLTDQQSLPAPSQLQPPTCAAMPMLNGWLREPLQGGPMKSLAAHSCSLSVVDPRIRR